MTDILNRDDRPTNVECKLAALTTDNRDKWAANRQRFFINDRDNRQFLGQIEQAIAIFVLDNDDYGYVEVCFSSFPMLGNKS